MKIGYFDMKTDTNFLLSQLSIFFLQREMFEILVVEEIKLHIFVQ